MNAKYYTKNVYGQTLIYLQDGKTENTILWLIGKKTITLGEMEKFKTLGITFERVFEPEEDRPEPGVQYALTGARGTPSIANGNTWAESRVQQ